MTQLRRAALAYARHHRRKFLSELKTFLQFPSVSSQTGRAQDIRRCAEWLARHLRQIGISNVRILPTGRSPVVYGSWLRAAGKPTLLIYGHYDVLPAEPLQEWKTPPFTPTIKGWDLYGRGADDDKSQLLCHVKAIECFLQGAGSLPINIKCIFEGEEEIGSGHLLPFIARNKHELRADAALVSDTKMLGPGRPAISYAQRGGLRAEIAVKGPKQDLHAGTFGGAVLNPVQALCEIIARLHDKDRRIAIPGFYDDVRNWSDKERHYMSQVGPGDKQILENAGVTHAWGERGYSLYERTTTRPALVLNGLAGGHYGPGVKGVIPTSALAKLSFRLVPDQNPRRVDKLFREYIEHIAPPAVQVSVRTMAPIQPAYLDRDHPAIRTAVFAYMKGFGARPVFIRSGGSIPVVNTFQEHLGIPTVLMGFGLPDDRNHAPNEKFHIPNFYRGIETCIWYMAAASQTLRRADRTSRSAEQEECWRDH
jgi:acetylornithine deacetylase/succinyl-diaminopimelate desuccinylase-like protein